MKYIRLLPFLFLCILLPLAAGALENYIFKVTTGPDIQYETLTIERDATGFIVKTPISLNYFDKTNNQVVWEVSEAAGSHFKAERFGNTIKLTGTYKNEQVNKEYQIDHRPWYQYPEVTLQEFALSDDQKYEFWIISLNDLRIFEFQAMKKDTETIKISGDLLKTIRIRIKAKGFAGIFWHADYWFDQANGRYLRYQAIHGGPGTLPTIKEFITHKR